MPVKDGVSVRIAQSLIDKIDAQLPEYLDRTGYLNQILDQALTGRDTLKTTAQISGEQSSKDEDTEPKNKKVPSNARALPINEDTGEVLSISQRKDPFCRKDIKEAFSGACPPDLRDVEDLIVEFWSVKKGTRSKKVMQRIINKLLEAPIADRGQMLTRAINNGWGDVFSVKEQFSGQNPRPVVNYLN